MTLYRIAEQVAAWRAQGRPAQLARVVETVGISSRDRAAAVAYSAGLPLAGTLFSGAADPGAVFAGAVSDGARLTWLPISEAAAARAGLSCGGRARLLVQPATDLDWEPVLAGEPVCWVTDLPLGETRCYRVADLPRSEASDPRLAELARLVRGGVSQTLVLDSPDMVVTVLWPDVRVFVVGGGQIAEALAANADLLGWQLTALDSLATAGPLRGSDNVIVLDHDLEVSGQALLTALASDCGYVGALGSRHTQAARAGWLAEHGTTGELLDRIHGPAGLNIGSRTPAEIALSILAEIVQVRAG
ncbi:MAG: XdhC family protein [Actinomycetota bacterium]|nr:XdhC family protein [Actinomycetota bacterium]MDQ2958137.1 XdhC family protein [Actinomycetota bacterium]